MVYERIFRKDAIRMIAFLAGAQEYNVVRWSSDKPFVVVTVIVVRKFLSYQ